MNNINDGKVNNLKKGAKFVLFATSYIPLFILIALKQISENSDYLNWGGFNLASVSLFLRCFGLSVVGIIISVTGLIGSAITFKNVEKYSSNGENVIVSRIDNKNSESIGYIATYIVPFLFKSFNGWYEVVAFLFLMIIIYRIYINSNLMLINPVLSFKYSLFEIEYKQNGKIRNGLIITKNKYLEEDSVIKIYEIGFKLFYATKK